MKAISSSLLSLWVGMILISPAKAQITSDGTTNTSISPTDKGFIIDNGDRAGGNLFHSFREFSVLRGSEAFFNNANDVVNIFSRVTGGNISNIDGLIRANGGANLFVINPAGIIFGENASLDIGGSFYGSTANSILFPNNVEFAASNPVKPILTINAPIGLRFSDNPGNIVSSNNTLVEPLKPGITFALLGGEVTLNNTEIKPMSGRVEIAGVGAGETIQLHHSNGSWQFDYSDITNFVSKVVVVGLAPVYDTRVQPFVWLQTHGCSNEAIAPYNKALRQFSEEKDLSFIDMDNVYGDDVAGCLPDGIHPNAKGHQLIFERVKTALEKENIL